jgi:hypothetical protein
MAMCVQGVSLFLPLIWLGLCPHRLVTDRFYIAPALRLVYQARLESPIYRSTLVFLVLVSSSFLPPSLPSSLVATIHTHYTALTGHRSFFWIFPFSSHRSTHFLVTIVNYDQPFRQPSTFPYCTASQTCGSLCSARFCCCQPWHDAEGMQCHLHLVKRPTGSFP